jgi:hypothetical protein
MQDEDEKQPSEMTSEELLDYAIAPEVAEQVRAYIQEENCEPEDED